MVILLWSPKGTFYREVADTARLTWRPTSRFVIRISWCTSCRNTSFVSNSWQKKLLTVHPCWFLLQVSLERKGLRLRRLPVTRPAEKRFSLLPFFWGWWILLHSVGTRSVLSQPKQTAPAAYNNEKLQSWKFLEQIKKPPSNPVCNGSEWSGSFFCSLIQKESNVPFDLKMNWILQFVHVQVSPLNSKHKNPSKILPNIRPNFSISRPMWQRGPRKAWTHPENKNQTIFKKKPQCLKTRKLVPNPQNSTGFWDAPLCYIYTRNTFQHVYSTAINQQRRRMSFHNNHQEQKW